MNKTQSPNSMSMAAIFRAVHECRTKPVGDPQRIIILLAPALDERTAPPLTTVLVSDAATFGRQELENLTHLVNHTRAVPVLRVSEEAWHGWNRRWPRQAAQIRRRTHLVVKLNQPHLAAT
jgi:hypothetical protein